MIQQLELFCMIFYISAALLPLNLIVYMERNYMCLIQNSKALSFALSCTRIPKHLNVLSFYCVCVVRTTMFTAQNRLKSE